MVKTQELFSLQDLTTVITGGSGEKDVIHRSLPQHILVI